MAGVKKTLSEKEQTLHDIINDAKKKLAKLQDKQKIKIGELACEHGLHHFDLDVLDEEFKKLATSLKMKNRS